MNNPADLLYTREHEWVRIEDKTATIGITDYAQSGLGDIVFVELPALIRWGFPDGL
jgi:glycine cleavage system H protein